MSEENKVEEIASKEESNQPSSPMINIDVFAMHKDYLAAISDVFRKTSSYDQCEDIHKRFNNILKKHMNPSESQPIKKAIHN